MSEKSIRLTTDEVRSVLDGRKVQKRIVIKPQPEEPIMYCYAGSHKWMIGKWGDKKAENWFTPPCNTDDILWVREKWTTLPHVDEYGDTHYDEEIIYYAADGCPDINLYDAQGVALDNKKIKWRPSIHLPRSAARIFLRVKNVRVERLHDISLGGCYAEGCTETYEREPLNWFKRDWARAIKKQNIDKYGWGVNPWVWVITFERVEA